VAYAQAQVGDLPGALNTLRQIPAESQNHVHAVAAIARAQAASGQGEVALQAVNRLGSANQQVYGLSLVAVGQAKAGDLKAARASGAKALVLAQTIKEPQRRSALYNLVFARILAEDLPGALETASHLPGGELLAYTSI